MQHLYFKLSWTPWRSLGGDPDFHALKAPAHPHDHAHNHISDRIKIRLFKHFSACPECKGLSNFSQKNCPFLLKWLAFQCHTALCTDRTFFCDAVSCASGKITTCSPPRLSVSLGLMAFSHFSAETQEKKITSMPVTI